MTRRDHTDTSFSSSSSFSSPEENFLLESSASEDSSDARTSSALVNSTMSTASIGLNMIHNNSCPDRDTDLASTAFQGFHMLCSYDESPGAATATAAASAASAAQSNETLIRKSSSLSSSNYQQLRHLVNTNSRNKAAFLWQSENLCCHAEQTTSSSNTQSEHHDLILFEEPIYSDDDDADLNKDGYCNSDDDFDQHETELAMALERPRSTVDSRHSDSNHGHEEGSNGTKNDPRYVPRPSSTTPGLREMSRLFHTSSLPSQDQLAQRRYAVQEEEPIVVVRPTPVQPVRAIDAGGLTAPHRTIFHASKRLKSLSNKKIPSPLTKSMSTPPMRFNPVMYRRARSQDDHALAATPIDTNTNRTALSISPPPLTKIHSFGKKLGLPPLHRRTTSDASGGSDVCGDGQGTSNHPNKKTSKKNPVKTLLKRSRLPSFRKPKFQSLGSKKQSDRDRSITPTESPVVEGRCSDVANILASLEATHLEYSRHQQGKSRSRQAKKSNKYNKASGSSPVSHQDSGGTQSETSSIGDLFDNIDDDDDDICYSESSQESRSTPYEDSNNQKFHKCFSKKAGNKTSSWHQYQQQEDCNSLLSSKTELLRCASEATAKASNLSDDPAADRAKLLDLQAKLSQQEEEQRKRFSAPPIEFDAPGGDNLIRVRDAVCEIEVVPKRDKDLNTIAEF